MVRHGRFQLFLAVITAVLIITPTTTGSTDQENCDKNIRTGFGVFLDFIKDRPDLSPLTFKSVEPCEKCDVYGMNDMAIHGPCQSKKNGECESIDHDMTWRCRELRMVCICTLPINPAELVKTMQNGATEDRRKSYPCNVTAESMEQFKPKGADVTTILKVNDLLKSSECAPLSLPPLKPSSIPTSFGAAASTLKDNAKPPPDKVKGTFVILWPNVDLKIGLRHTVATDEIKPYTGHLGDTDPSTIAVECISSEKIAGEDRFQAPCECLKKANFMKNLILQVIDVLMPCFCSMGLEQMAGDGNVTEAKEISKTVFNEMSCKEFYCG